MGCCWARTLISFIRAGCIDGSRRDLHRSRSDDAASNQPFEVEDTAMSAAGRTTLADGSGLQLEHVKTQ